MQRYFTDESLTGGASVTLHGAVEHHAITVLRMQVGGQFELAGAQGHAFVVTITGIDPLTVRVEQRIAANHELPVAVTIVCGISKGQKAELIVQKATELGVTRVLFVNTQWATARWLPDRAAKKVARLQQVAQSAAEQSHRDVVPTVGFVPLLDAVMRLDADAKLVAYEESAKQGEHAQLIQTLSAHPRSLLAVFGPEGGLAPEEVAALNAAGFVNAGLGPRILRTETAPWYLLAAISTYTELQEDSQHLVNSEKN